MLERATRSPDTARLAAIARILRINENLEQPDHWLACAALAIALARRGDVDAALAQAQQLNEQIASANGPSPLQPILSLVEGARTEDPDHAYALGKVISTLKGL